MNEKTLASARISYQSIIFAILPIAIIWIVAGFFVYAGAKKALDPSLFLFYIRTFHILPDPYAAYTALGLPWLEILCGFCIAAGFFRKGGAFILFCASSVFLWAKIYSWQRGLDIMCGCFGKTTMETNYPKEITISVLFVLGTLFVLLYSLFEKEGVEDPEEPESAPAEA